MFERPDQFVLWGSAGHARVLAEVIVMRGGKVIALFDNNGAALSALSDVSIYVGEDGFQTWLEHIGNKKELVSGLAAVGGDHGLDRLKIQGLFLEHGLSVPVLKHPSAVVSPSAVVGKGTQILALANIAAEVTIGDGCIINHLASVDHECSVGSGVHVGPSATLCGCVSVAENVFIGAGAVVLPRISIGANSVIGAGAVVTKDVFTGSILAGNPARPI